MKVNVIDDIAVQFGTATRESIEFLGAISIFFWRILRELPRALLKYHLIIEQMMRMGVESIPIVFLTSIFIGAVTAWQAQYLFANVIPLTFLGFAAGKAILVDLGPVFSALVITGRIGAKLAAELGTMRVNEQIDAMDCLSLDPYLYLLLPRLMAGFIMMPVLFIFTSFFALVSAQIVATVGLGLSPYAFYNSIKMLFNMKDLVVGLVKAFVFGGVIALSGCYYGFFTTGGAVGVGESTKKAVVGASVLILVTNLLVVNVIL